MMVCGVLLRNAMTVFSLVASVRVSMSAHNVWLDMGVYTKVIVSLSVHLDIF